MKRGGSAVGCGCVRAGLAAVAVVATVLTPRAGVAGGGFNVVVSAQNHVASLSASELKRLVSGGTKLWDGGAVVQLGIIPSDAPETQYLATTLDTTPRELLSMIQQQVFKGELRRPAVLRSSADCLALVAQNPGGFCVASAAVAVPDGARVVPVR